MNDLYLVRRDVLDRIHQNPNAVPVVYPDRLGAILREADVPAIVQEAVTRLELPAIEGDGQSRLAGLDKEALIRDLKARRDLIGLLDDRGYDESVAGSRAAWELLWDGMRAWDNRSWNWPAIAAGTALAWLFCPPTAAAEAAVLARGSTAH